MSKAKIKKSVWFCGIIFITITSYGQYRHEFSLSGGGGLSTLNYDLRDGIQNDGFGGLFSFGYRYFFNRATGLATGLEYAFYNAHCQLDVVNIAYQTTDYAGDAFEFRSALKDYREKQRAMFLQIPLMLQFQTGSKHMFYAAGGVKLGIPLNNLKTTYDCEVTELRNSGFYYDDNVLYETQPFMGFGKFSNVHGMGSLLFKPSLFASAEIGVKWRLNDFMALYSGVYFDYGLNSIFETRDAVHLPPLVEYNNGNPHDFTLNSVFNSSQIFTDAIKPLSAGVVLRWSLGRDRRFEDTPRSKRIYQPDTEEIHDIAKSTVPVAVSTQQNNKAIALHLLLMGNNEMIFGTGAKFFYKNPNEPWRMATEFGVYPNEINLIDFGIYGHYTLSAGESLALYPLGGIGMMGAEGLYFFTYSFGAGFDISLSKKLIFNSEYKIKLFRGSGYMNNLAFGFSILF